MIQRQISLFNIKHVLITMKISHIGDKFLKIIIIYCMSESFRLDNENSELNLRFSRIKIILYLKGN